MCGVKLRLFDRVIVKISIETRNLQHQKMKLELVEPKVNTTSLSLTDSTESHTK